MLRSSIFTTDFFRGGRHLDFRHKNPSFLLLSVVLLTRHERHEYPRVSVRKLSFRFTQRSKRDGCTPSLTPICHGDTHLFSLPLIRSDVVIEYWVFLSLKKCRLFYQKSRNIETDIDTISYNFGSGCSGAKYG